MSEKERSADNANEFPNLPTDPLNYDPNSELKPYEIPKLSHHESFDRTPFRNPRSYYLNTSPITSGLLYGTGEKSSGAFEREGFRRIGDKKSGTFASVGPYGPHPVLARIRDTKRNFGVRHMEGSNPALVLTPLKTIMDNDYRLDIMPEVRNFSRARTTGEAELLFKYSRFLELLSIASGHYPFDCRPANMGFLNSDDLPVIYDQETMVTIKNQFESSYKGDRDFHIKRDLNAAKSIDDKSIKTLTREDWRNGKGSIPDWYTQAVFLSEQPFSGWLERIFTQDKFDKLLRETNVNPELSDSKAQLIGIALVRLEELLTQGAKEDVMSRIQRLKPLTDEILKEVNSFFSEAQQDHCLHAGISPDNPVYHESLIADADFKNWLALRSKELGIDPEGEIVKAVREDGWNRDTLHEIVTDAAKFQETGKPWAEAMAAAREKWRKGGNEPPTF